MTSIRSVLLLAAAGMLVLLPMDMLRAQPTVGYFGDSITEGWIDAEKQPAFAFPALLDSLLAEEGLDFRSVVAARGGETTDDALARFEEIRSLDPALLVFAFGSNDYFVWGNPPAPRVSLDRFRFNCRVMFEALSGSGCRVLVILPPPVVEERFRDYVDVSVFEEYGGVSSLRDAYAAAVEDVAAQVPGLRAVRLDTLLLADSARMGFDGVHPSRLGHREIAAALLPLVSGMLRLGPITQETPETLSCYPMPFQRLRTGVSSIRFTADADGTVVLQIFDAAGRRVRKIVYYAHRAGSHSILWNGRDENGTIVPAGAYTLALQSATRGPRVLSIIVQ